MTTFFRPPRGADGADDGDQLRPLNLPTPIRVRCDAHGQPYAVLLDSGWMVVSAIVDAWVIEDEWWRSSTRRRYVQVMLADDRVLTLFEDLEDASDARWYRQRLAVRG